MTGPLESIPAIRGVYLYHHFHYRNHGDRAPLSNLTPFQISESARIRLRDAPTRRPRGFDLNSRLLLIDAIGNQFPDSALRRWP